MGDKLKAFLEKRNIDILDFAISSEMSITETIDLIENNKPIDAVDFYFMAKALNVSLDYLASEVL